MKTITCKVCGESFEVPSSRGRYPSRCESCREDAPVGRTCVVCGNTYVRRGPGTTCDECEAPGWIPLRKEPVTPGKTVVRVMLDMFSSYERAENNALRYGTKAKVLSVEGDKACLSVKGKTITTDSGFLLVVSR